MPWSSRMFLYGCVLLLLSSSSLPSLSSYTSPVSSSFFFVAGYEPPDGPASLATGDRLFQEHQYDDAAESYWKAVLMHGQTDASRTYDVQSVFQKFMQCYIVQGKMVDGLAYVADNAFQRGQTDMGQQYLEQALSIDPENAAALAVQDEFGTGGTGASAVGTSSASKSGDNEMVDDEDENPDLQGKSAEQLYEIAAEHFANKDYEECADIFEISCLRSRGKLGPSCSNAVYCRNMITDWGFNGTQFDKDMEGISRLTEKETKLYRQPSAAVENSNKDQEGRRDFTWRRATSVHPHMMLSYPIDVMLKRYVTESVAFMDEPMARAGKGMDEGGGITPLPKGLPYNWDDHRAVEETSSSRIRVGFVGSGFNSKAVLYLSQDMFRFFDTSRFEIHVFSMGPPDKELFIEHGMRGVDWRKRVQANVEYFHDCQAMKFDHIELAEFVHDKGIHMLIEWDGYARQGERAQGLFALRPAPIQILHQEYLGTSGALYVDYLFSDMITSPPELDYLYTEKLIYMPNHFFSKGHAMQPEVKVPTYEYVSKDSVAYELGKGSPRQNRCMAPRRVGPAEPSFVFCNFNKLLKSNPEAVRSWIRILREVPDSMICLLEYPEKAVPYLRKFIHEAAGTSFNNSDPYSFVAGDGDELNDRIHFLSWSANPFDHQARNQDFCNVMLDSHPYNGHTVAQDSLYGGVPIITRSDGDDMASLVTTSANTVLDLTELNAYNGSRQYEEIAIRLGNNATLYQNLRTKLIDSCLQRNPMHRYWDVARYVKNFEAGLQTAWDSFLSGKEPGHIYIEESEEAARGTFDDEILAHPVEGNKKSENNLSDEL
jgi:protein O-GlcNAc transferase